MEKKELLKLREKMSKRRPQFKRQDTHMRTRVSHTSWRKPRGMHSKMRVEEKSKYRKVKIGFCSPKAVRGLHKSGKEFLRIFNLADLDKAEASKHILIISAVIGAKKKLQILTEAQKRGLEIQNLDAKKFEEKMKLQMASRKEERKAHKAKKDKKAKKASEKDKSKKEKKDAEKKEEVKPSKNEKKEVNNDKPQ